MKRHHNTPLYMEIVVVLATFLFILAGGIAIGSILTARSYDVQPEPAALTAPEISQQEQELRRQSRLQLLTTGIPMEAYSPPDSLPIVYPPVETMSPIIEEPEPQLPEEEPEPQLPEEEVIPEPTPQEIVLSSLGNDVIETSVGTLTRYELPSIYYPNLKFSEFCAWMPYSVITNKSSPAYKVVHDEHAYEDENGLLRFRLEEGQFSIDGTDDYVVALGTYYKPKGTCGDRWLIITTTGAYTATTGDEKDDHDTDSHNMVTFDGNLCTGMVEFLVNTKTLNKDIKRAGTVTKGPIEALQGTIQYIYRIS